MHISLFYCDTPLLDFYIQPLRWPCWFTRYTVPLIHFFTVHGPSQFVYHHCLRLMLHMWSYSVGPILLPFVSSFCGWFFSSSPHVFSLYICKVSTAATISCFPTCDIRYQASCRPAIKTVAWSPWVLWQSWHRAFPPSSFSIVFFFLWYHHHTCFGHLVSLIFSRRPYHRNHFVSTVSIMVYDPSLFPNVPISFFSNSCFLSVCLTFSFFHLPFVLFHSNETSTAIFSKLSLSKHGLFNYFFFYSPCCCLY